MKKNKIKFLALLLVAFIGLVACTPTDTNLDGNRNRNLSTQTRIGDNRWNTGTNTIERDNDNIDPDNLIDRNNNQMSPNTSPDNLNQNTRPNHGSGLNTNIGDGASRPNDRLNTNLNDGMTRPNDRLSTRMTDSNTKAKDLAKEIADLPEVDKASVVLTDNTALVGCRLRGNKQDTMTTSLRNKIEDIVKKSNKDIKDVSITTDPDLYGRIKGIANDMGTGNPIEGLTDEIEDIIRNITPGTRNTR